MKQEQDREGEKVSQTKTLWLCLVQKEVCPPEAGPFEGLDCLNHGGCRGTCKRRARQIQEEVTHGLLLHR